MLKIAIIQFPGLNTEYETRREINKTGMRGEFFRWNEDSKKLAAYDGYVIGGGFAYEDRGRAGIIASLEPIMKELKAQAEKGKPVLGICNGAQILVEAGLIPGADGNKLAMALARNKRIKDGEVLGTGYYNTWVHFKCTAPKQSCMFTWNIPEGEILNAPIAHGEGRFTTDIAELFPVLQSKGQIAMRYCDGHGVITQDFPVNPNGAVFNTAAICNPAGNVMAVMPHLERDLVSSAKLFTSLRDALIARKAGGLLPAGRHGKKRVHHLHVKPINSWPLQPFQPKEKSFKLFISLIITDNEADTFEMTIKNLGWPKISLKRRTLVELEYQGRPDFLGLSRKLIQSGVLLNTNKESVTVEPPKQRLVFDAKREKFLEPVTFQLLVREKPDFVGMAKLATIQKRLKFNEITGVHIGTLWEIHIPTKSKNVAEQEFRRLVGTNLFFNPHRQEAYLVNG